jgi:hypothetical protein
MQVEALDQMQFRLLQALCGEWCPIVTFLNRFSMEFSDNEIEPGFEQARYKAARQLCSEGILEEYKLGKVRPTEKGYLIWSEYRERIPLPAIGEEDGQNDFDFIINESACELATNEDDAKWVTYLEVD